MILWRERDHDSEEIQMLNDLAWIIYLHRFGLMKYARLDLMKGQEELLSWIIQRWDEHQCVFQIRDHEIMIERYDIYFMMGLSCRGAWVNWTEEKIDPRTTLKLVQTHYRPSSGLVPIDRISIRPMRAILWIIVCLVRSKSSHVATKAQLLLVIDCLQPHIFNWCEGFLRQVKEELIACKTHTQRKFWYGTLIVSFFFERFPMLKQQMSLG